MKIVRSALAAQLRFVAFAFLMVSVSSELPAQESGPAFSWDRVSLYAHVGLGRGLKPEEYQFLAEHYDFIALTGGALDRDYRTGKSVSFEPIATDAAKTIKQHNPNAKVLFYLASDFAKPHNKLSNATIPKDGLIKVRRNGKKTVDVFDTTNQATRDWWTDVAAKAVHEYGCDGIFVDGATAYTPGSLYERRLWKRECSTCLRRRSERWAKVPSS